ncbi:Ribokinase-like protein [Penicillium lagena]|uniref:Ribokinase-like protein n=1 Tax=Penicillium lagena TaxID=94218 RepID=UPI002541FCD0|nr:Ribokinase-like protein [Penicillium lagena]KAJ5623926.1 Ribokinase-like protein [Penicillium lagena]
MSVVAVGACYVDTILTTPHYPGEDEKLRASSVTRRRGGNCPNTLEVLQQLAQHAPLNQSPTLNLITVLPAKSSVASEQIRSAFEPRVRLDHCIYRDQFTEPASSYIIKSQSTGSRTIVNYNELPEMTVEEFSRIADDLGPRTTWFHFEVRGMSQGFLGLPTWRRSKINFRANCFQGRVPDVTLGCIHYLRQHFPNARVSVEVEKPGRDGLQELAGEADVVFYSKGWALVRILSCLQF